jgi:hypothetical protein
VNAVAALAIWADAHQVDRFSREYVKCLMLADRIVFPEHIETWLEFSKNLLSGIGTYD